MCISPPVTPTWKPGSGAELTTNGASLLPLLLHQKFFLQSPKPKGCAAALGAGGSGSPDKPPASPKAKFVNNTLTRSRGNRGRKFNHTGVVQNPSHCFLQDAVQKMTLPVYPAFFLFLIFHQNPVRNTAQKRKCHGEACSFIGIYLVLVLPASTNPGLHHGCEGVRKN